MPAATEHWTPAPVARGLTTSVLGSLGLAALDLAVLAHHEVEVSLWPPIFGACAALCWVGTLPLGVLGAWLCGKPAGARLVQALARPHARVVAWVLGSAVALGLLALNTLFFARLYLSLHLLLTLALLVWVSALLVLLLPQWRAPSRFAILAFFSLWLVGGAWGVTLIATRPPLRHSALDQTTTTAHALLVLRTLTGALRPEQPVGADPIVGDLAPQQLPRPRGDHAGKHFLLLTVDALRHDRDLSVYARLGSSGLRFAHAYAPSCWTLHSMGATLTSRLPSQLHFTPTSVTPDLRFIERSARVLIENPLAKRGITPTPIRDETPTLTGLLRAAGYQTFTVAPYVFYLPEAGLTREFEGVDADVIRAGGGTGLDGMGQVTLSLTDRALSLLDGRDEARPFFLWLHYMEPHAPYEAHGDVAANAPAEVRYDSELRHVDGEIGRLLDGMQQRGLLAQSIIALHADHGEEFGDHGGAFHGTTVYEEIIRVPFVLHVPAVKARSEPGPVSLIDLAPTVLDLLGVASSTPMVGRSLAPLLRGESLEPRPVVAECQRFGRDKVARIEWPRKLIVDRAVGTAEIYDLVADPAERRNLAR